MSKQAIKTKQVLLTRQELATRWGVSIETIKRREKDGTLRAIRLPGCRAVRFRLSEIEAIEEQGAVA